VGPDRFTTPAEMSASEMGRFINFSIKEGSRRPFEIKVSPLTASFFRDFYANSDLRLLPLVFIFLPPFFCLYFPSRLRAPVNDYFHTVLSAFLCCSLRPPR